MNQKFSRCPVCQLDNQKVFAEQDVGRKITYECLRCGQYTIAFTSMDIPKDKNKTAEVSAWLRERNLYGVEIPLLSSGFLRELFKNLPQYTVSEKQNKLLRAIEKLTEYPGGEVLLKPENDLSLSWAKNEAEFNFYIKSLTNRDLIEISSTRLRSTCPVVITANGWEYLAKSQSDISSRVQAFVAMSFDKELIPVYEKAIYPAIDSTGYRPYRVDSDHHLDRIDAKIIAEIKNSRFMVADVTHQKAGVYYEAGFAHGLWGCQ